MLTNNKKLVDAALREFYTASVDPLQKYQSRLAQIRSDYEAALVPFQAAVDAAEKDVNEKRRVLYSETELAVPELKKPYDAAHAFAREYYNIQAKPYFALRELGFQAAETLYSELVAGQVADTDSFANIGMSLDALYANVHGKPETLGARDCTKSFVRDIFQKAFLETLEPLEQGRESIVRPTEEPYRKALGEAVAGANRNLNLASENLQSAEKALRDAKSKHYKEFLQARADARKECEQILLPLREQLQEKVTTAFENLATR